MSARDKVIEHLAGISGTSGLDSQQYLTAQQRAVAAETDSSVSPRYRALQVGENDVFMTQGDSSVSKYVDDAFVYKRFWDNVPTGNWVGLPDITDKFRASSGMFWISKEVQQPYGWASPSESGLAYMLQYSHAESKIPMKMHFNSLVPAAEHEDGSMTEWVLIEGGALNHMSEFSAQKFHTHLLRLKDNTGVQLDYTMSVPRLTDITKIQEKNSSLATPYADIHGDYNYYDGRYENTISNDIVSETTIPNMYVFFAYQDSENPNPAFKKHLSLGDRINLSDYQELFNGVMTNNQVKATPTERYYDKWSAAYISAFQDATTVELGTKFKNIILAADDMDKFASYETHKEMFPMWMHVEFSTDRMTEFAETLKDSQLMGLLQQSLVGALRSSSGSLLTSMKFFQASTVDAPTITAAAVASSEASPPKTTVYSTRQRRVYNLDDWMDAFLDEGYESNVNVDADSVDEIYSTFLGTFDSSNIISNAPKYKFYKSLMAIILKGKIRKLLKKHTRTIEQVLKGEPCHHEAVLYRVSKFKGDTPTPGAEVQSFYIPNSNDLDIFKYIDTQVKYNEQYTYTINVYELVVGNRYEYGDIVHELSYDKWAAVPITNRPSVRLVEVPLYKYTNRVIDNPPIHPEVEFVPFKGINNKIKLLLNSGIGRYTIPVEIIDPRERPMINRLKEAQNREIEDSDLTYETDDYPAFYEVFRTTEKPKSFADFTGKKRHHVSTTLKDGNLISSGLGLIDKIAPNQKYYYCVRAIDVHQHISYPSPIYQVEMVDDGGSIFPIIQLCEFAPEHESQQALGGRRYIHIQPTMPQMLINEEASGLMDVSSVADLERVSLSISEEPLWGRKFKIRLTSKSTGRKMDFNVSFTHKHLKLENRD